MEAVVLAVMAIIAELQEMEWEGEVMIGRHEDGAVDWWPNGTTDGLGRRFIYYTPSVTMVTREGIELALESRLKELNVQRCVAGWTHLNVL